MAGSDWELAMRRIDSEYDLPQFVAARLVRKIAANNFRLPSTDRDAFPKLADHVIARIEQIVRDAYLEAGEDVGRDILREHLGQQAIKARQESVTCGEFLTPRDFKEVIGRLTSGLPNCWKMGACLQSRSTEPRTFLPS